MPLGGGTASDDALLRGEIAMPRLGSQGTKLMGHENPPDPCSASLRNWSLRVVMGIRNKMMRVLER